MKPENFVRIVLLLIGFTVIFTALTIGWSIFKGGII